MIPREALGRVGDLFLPEQQTETIDPDDMPIDPDEAAAVLV